MRYKIVLTNKQLEYLLTHPETSEVFYKLLQRRKRLISYQSFDELAKELGYETRSGIWKALKKLEALKLIVIAKYLRFICLMIEVE